MWDNYIRAKIQKTDLCFPVMFLTTFSHAKMTVLFQKKKFSSMTLQDIEDRVGCIWVRVEI